MIYSNPFFPLSWASDPLESWDKTEEKREKKVEWQSILWASDDTIHHEDDEI